MKQLFSQYAGLKKEIYILFVGKLVTAMGSFVWPMLTFFLTTKLGLSDGTSTLLIATASVLSFPAAILGGKLADRFRRKNIIILFDFLTISLYFLAAVLPLTFATAALLFLAGLFQTLESPAYDALNADYSTSAQREKAYSLSYLGFNLGFIIGASFPAPSAPGVFESLLNLGIVTAEVGRAESDVCPMRREVIHIKGRVFSAGDIFAATFGNSAASVVDIEAVEANGGDGFPVRLDAEEVHSLTEPDGFS